MATANRNNSYIYGTAARQIDVKKALQEAPSRKPLVELRAEQLKAKKMNTSPIYVAFFAIAMVVLGMVLVSYLSLQSDITILVRNISNYEAEANRLTLENDSNYSKMIESIDYEEIRRSAIEDLGMVYPSQDQIITYTRENSDYVRQVNDLTN